ncbi:fimbrial protein [Proteus myxofaciens]|uniref:Fimbrial-type adhesion domain-containing protein n=1 Tax=Proteus myxofaciens ATCC 19692 TaxID=1354337 RepID=A0A198GBY7_9GAMM|nr:fimbrial protein [Proteus myxofaciens]OAT34598.1 hypothetical protein M983_1046 [Proteus myxofaciens ATCC 19692]
MTLFSTVSLRLGFITCLLFTSVYSWADNKASLSLHAMVANKGLSCELVLPQNVLQFKPLQANQLTGSVRTFQVLPLHLEMMCGDENENIIPTLTLSGETPYSQDTEQAVFLSGTPNGVGFMVRKSADDKPINVTDFYQPKSAIVKGGLGQPLTELNDKNFYRSDAVLWVGLVGPFQPEVIPGQFHASLILNMSFE